MSFPKPAKIIEPISRPKQHKQRFGTENPNRVFGAPNCRKRANKKRFALAMPNRSVLIWRFNLLRPHHTTGGGGGGGGGNYWGGGAGAGRTGIIYIHIYIYIDRHTQYTGLSACLSVCLSACVYVHYVCFLARMHAVVTTE